MALLGLCLQLHGLTQVICYSSTVATTERALLRA
jgi:hypothetical protein